MQQLLFTACFLASLGLMAQIDSVGNTDSPFINEFLDRWDNSRDYTLLVLENMPEDGLNYRPTEDQMTFREQLLHNLSHMTRFSTRYLGASPFPKQDILKIKPNEMSKEELKSLSQEAFAFARKAAYALNAEKLEERVPFFAGPKTRRQILILLNDHLAHHRGQMIVYLRLMGAKPPPYIGW